MKPSNGETTEGMGALPLRIKGSQDKPKIVRCLVPLGEGDKMMQVPESGPNDVIPDGISERDWLAWRCMRDTLTWMYDNRSKNVTQACEGTGWERRYWYRIRDNEYVQSEMMRLANTNRAAEFMAINARWMSVLRAQVAIASDDKADPRASTAAAKWLGERLDKITDEGDDLLDTRASRKSRARRNLERLMESAAGQPVTVERTERITVGNAERIPDDAIEGEVSVIRDAATLVP